MSDDDTRSLLEEAAIDQAQGEQKLCQAFLMHCDDIAQVWATQPGLTPYERTSGTVFSIMAALDGTSPGIPIFDVVSAAHCTVENTLIEEGTVITRDRYLHDEYVRIRDLRNEAASKQVKEGEE